MMLGQQLIGSFTGKRTLKVILRTVHLVGMAGVFGAAMGGEFHPIYWALTGSSGLGLLLLESLSHFVWFVQLRGLTMYVKLVLLWALVQLPQQALLWNIMIILISGFISHASSDVRYFSLWHRRVILDKRDMQG